MKILMTTDAAGGVFTYCVQLAAALRVADVQVTFASMGRKLSPAQREEARAAGAQVVEGEYKLEWMDDPWQDVERAGRWLLELERRLAPDIVQINGYAHAALPFQAPVVSVAHSCVCSWWRAVLGEAAPPRYSRYRVEAARGLAGAAVTIAPTEAMLASLIAEYGPVRRAQVIHNGIRLAGVPRVAKEPLILTAGRVWDRAKNIACVGAAASALTWPVYVAGDATCPDGRGAPALPQLRSLGLLPRPELARWMARASIFALPASYEPFGLSILEAAAAGCALVIGDIPSLRELWGDAAVYVRPGNATALAGALERLIADPAARVQLGESAARRARRHPVALMARRYLHVYRSLAGRGTAPARHDRKESPKAELFP